jgi:hypothetical protein
MAEITKLNSGKGIVSFSEDDLIENNLLRYIRTSLKGIGKQALLSDHPFETVAASLYKEKYPSDQVKIAEKCLLKHGKDGAVSVDVILRVSQNIAETLYQEHPTKRVFKKEEKERSK